MNEWIKLRLLLEHITNSFALTCILFYQHFLYTMFIITWHHKKTMMYFQKESMHIILKKKKGKLLLSLLTDTQSLQPWPVGFWAPRPGRSPSLRRCTSGFTTHQPMSKVCPCVYQLSGPDNLNFPTILTLRVHTVPLFLPLALHRQDVAFPHHLHQTITLQGAHSNSTPSGRHFFCGLLCGCDLSSLTSPLALLRNQPHADHAAFHHPPCTCVGLGLCFSKCSPVHNNTFASSVLCSPGPVSLANPKQSAQASLTKCTGWVA